MPKSKKQNATAPAANEASTVGARHAVPEVSTSTVQPSSTASRRAAKDLSRPAGEAPRSKKHARKRNRSKPPSSQTTNDALAITLDARPVATTAAPRVHIGEAMRRSGLDEYKVAQTYATVVDKLSGKHADKDAGGVQKLLVDVLKECSRHLDPRHSERDAAPDAPVQFILIHEVARPDRSHQLKTSPVTPLPPAPALDDVAPVDDAL
jgi:hypothetical protein